MKNIFKSLLLATYAFGITSCGEVDMGNTPQAEEGLLSLTAKIAGHATRQKQDEAAQTMGSLMNNLS